MSSDIGVFGEGGDVLQGVVSFQNAPVAGDPRPTISKLVESCPAGKMQVACATGSGGFAAAASVWVKQRRVEQQFATVLAATLL